MSDPTSSNVLLALPVHGADVNTWDVPVNANSTAADGFFGGVVTVSLSNSPVTLSAPSGVVIPTAGPFQSQNRILKFTGTLTGNVQVTLPLPGEYTVQNLTVGNFVVTFAAAGAGNVTATPSGSIMHVWNDGTNVWPVKPTIPGALTFLGGVSAVPAWITACTVRPFLLCDGTVYNYSTYTALGNLYGGSFGGNGITTFGVQDLRGRVPLAYDGTGTRITVAGCGLNGQTLGAAGGAQDVALTAGMMPTITSSNPSQAITVTSTVNLPQNLGSTSTNGGSVPCINANNINSPATSTGNNNISVTSNNTGGSTTPTVPPAQVSGIWLVST